MAEESTSNLSSNVLSSTGDEIIRLLAGQDTFDEIWQLTECFDEGFVPEKMVAAMKKKSSSEEVFCDDVRTLLMGYFNKEIMDSKIAKEYAALCDRYSIKGPGQLSDNAVTLSRLTMAFPYQTAIIRSRNKSIGSPLAVVNCYNCGRTTTQVHMLKYPFLAFHSAGLIIPVSWVGLWNSWENWYRRFLELKVEGPLPISLEARFKKQVKEMKLLSREKEEENNEIMRFLKVVN